MGTARLRYLLLLAAFVLLVLFNVRTADVDTVEQRQYEAWLSERDQTAIPEQSEILPQNLVVSLSGVRRVGEPPITWQLRSIDGENARERALRILQMAREANLFTVGSKASTDAGLVLEIQEGEKKFSVGITPEVVEQNLRVATMLRLFKEYAQPIPSAVAAAELPAAGGETAVQKEQ